MSGGCLEARGARIWIFVGFVLGFAAIIAAVWRMIAYFSDGSEYRKTKPFYAKHQMDSNNSTSDFDFISILIIRFSKRPNCKQLAGHKSSSAECFHIFGFARFQIRPIGRPMELINRRGDKVASFLRI